MTKTLALAAVFLTCLVCGSLAQTYEPITAFASGAGRGFDIVNERIKTPLVHWTFEYQNEYPYLRERFAGALTLKSFLFSSFLFDLRFFRPAFLPCRIY